MDKYFYAHRDAMIADGWRCHVYILRYGLHPSSYGTEPNFAFWKKGCLPLDELHVMFRHSKLLGYHPLVQRRQNGDGAMKFVRASVSRACPPSAMATTQEEDLFFSDFVLRSHFRRSSLFINATATANLSTRKESSRPWRLPVLKSFDESAYQTTQAIRKQDLTYLSMSHLERWKWEASTGYRDLSSSTSQQQNCVRRKREEISSHKKNPPKPFDKTNHQA